MKHSENKVSNNIDLLYKAKQFVDQISLLALYHSYIHSYLNYANTAGGSTNMTNFKKLLALQKHAI